MVRTEVPIAIASFERNTFEYVNEQLDAEPSETQSNYNFTKAIEESYTELLTLFHTKFPRELRDLVYNHLIGQLPGFHDKALDASNHIFIVQPPHYLFHFNVFKPLTPLHFPPPQLQHFQSTSRSPDTTAVINAIVFELTTHFFSSATFYIHYRFTPHLLTFLTTPFQSTSCIPIQHLRRLNIILSAPESAEDGVVDYDELDLEAEFSWKHIFPSHGIVVNEKCRMYRDMLKGDFEKLAEVIGGNGDGKCETELGPYVADVRYEEGKGEMVPREMGLMHWLGKWVESVRMRGVRVRWLVP